MSEAVRGFVVTTKCETVEQFVERYHTRVDETSIFVGVVEERVLGNECAFAFLLANKQPVLAGICVVLDLFRDENNPYRRRGMRIDIRRLGVTSEGVFEDLRSARAATKRRFAHGTEVPELDDGIPISIDDDISDAFPIDLQEVLTSPPVVR